MQDGRCRSALYFLAAHLPKRSVAGIVRGTIETISSLEQSSKVCVCVCVCVWVGVCVGVGVCVKERM